MTTPPSAERGRPHPSSPDRLGRVVFGALRWVAVAVVGSAAASCRDEVSLGSWGLAVEPQPSLTPMPVASVDAGFGVPPGQPEGPTSGAVDGGGGAGGPSSELDASVSGMETGAAPDVGTDAATAPPPALPGCLAMGLPGPFNAPGTELGVTETSTDWAWVRPSNAVQWDLMIEREPPPRPAESPPEAGAYWVHQFSFRDGVAGRLGLQAEGGYQANPPNGEIKITKIAVFWLSGPPLAAEVGDFPSSRVAPLSAAGTSWLTIHAEFDWQICRPYRMRFAEESRDADGNIWYAASILDQMTEQEMVLGRMLLPVDTGLLAPFSTTITQPISFVELSCAEGPQTSAIFGAPIVDGEAASVTSNRFAASPRCGTSRFTQWPAAVRHELGVAQ